MSIFFAAFAVTVYATHKNWKDVVENPQTGLKAAIEKKKQELADLQKQRDELADQVAKEIAEKKQKLAELATYRERSEMSVKKLTEERDGLDKKQQEAVAAMAAAQQNLEKLTKEVEVLRQEIRVTQADRDKQFQQVVKLTDELHEATNVKTRIEERERQLAQQLATAKLVLFNNGLDMNPSAVPPPLRGKVLAVNQNDLLEVSLGSDDGLRPGNTLEVFRGSNYLGRVQVLETSPDKAVGKILPDFKKGIIQKDDNVATRFKLG
jgi:predicted  nucleic acid-binding Zn-ribbon protein